MKSDSKKFLDDYFQQLKDSIPSSDQRFVPKKPALSDKLVDLIRKSLTVIEAVYLQNPEMFPLARVEEYHRLIDELHALGFDYNAHRSLIERAATGAILSARLPMKKARSNKRIEDSDSMVG